MMLENLECSLNLPVIEFVNSSSLEDISPVAGEEHYEVPAKKQKLKSHAQATVLTKEKLQKIILNSPNGQDLFKEYNKLGIVTDINRKRIVSLVVTHLKDHKSKVQRSLHGWEKAECAQVIVDLFPKLRNPKGGLGYVSINHLIL
ncbi:hypothetical protein KQX54_009888 [Cotesia glomerata]|uniref:Uncharacterized protein n=1 Tax=Cotesia glomerata TaxID=32391 RepID=A0AAV7IKJ5_COTGL|nr:hypothetical protein KQX54_009888 [Cotesia glomerata]